MSILASPFILSYLIENKHDTTTTARLLQIRLWPLSCYSYVED